VSQRGMSVQLLPPLVEYWKTTAPVGGPWLSEPGAVIKKRRSGGERLAGHRAFRSERYRLGSLRDVHNLSDRGSRGGSVEVAVTRVNRLDLDPRRGGGEGGRRKAPILCG